MYMVPYAEENDGTKYILTVLDSFSRYLWVRTLADRKGATVAAAFKEILDEINQPVLSCLTDMGIEYKSLAFKNLMKDYDIHHYFSTTGMAAQVERCHRVLRAKLLKYMIKKNTMTYNDQLQNIVRSYNRTISTVTGVRPIDVFRANQYDIFQHITGKQKPYKPKPYKFKVGDTVAISYKRTPFDREFSERWTREVFTVARRYRNQNIAMYKLRDCSKEVMDGSYYEPEMQLILEDPRKLYIVEDILKKRNGQSLVKFQYYPKKCAKWLDDKEVKNLRRV